MQKLQTLGVAPVVTVACDLFLIHLFQSILHLCTGYCILQYIDVAHFIQYPFRTVSEFFEKPYMQYILRLGDMPL